MRQADGRIQLVLTPAQVEQIRGATGQTATVVVLRPEELEDRAVPAMAYQPWQSLE